MRTYRYICSCICILAALYGLPFPVWGQDNPYKITQNLYLLYEEANRHCYEPLGLQLADSLYRQSIRQGDKKAQCLALTIPVLHYVNKRQFKQVEEAVERIKEVSRKNGYLQYYYFGYSSSISQHINQGRTLLALQESKKMKEQAMADNYPYGIATCLRTMGNIYVTRRSPKEALKCYQEALKYSQKYVTDQDLAYLYRSISKQLHALKRYEEALQAAEQGIACAKTYKNKAACMQQKCEMLYALDRYEDFLSYYDFCVKDREKHGYNDRPNEWRILKMKYYIYTAQYDKAHFMADSVVHPIDRIAFHIDIYKKEGKFEEAFTTLLQLRELQDSLSQIVQASDLAEMDASLNNARLRKETQDLQLENAQLSLHAANYELSQARTAVEIEKVNTENNKLQLKNKNLELAQFKAETERKQAIMQAKQIESDRQLMGLKFILSILGLLLASLLSYLYMRHRSISKLEEKNKELTVARNKAEQADHMKTVFIQNMSHEIRTPLNAIVGFSQLLSDPDLPLGEEEKKEFCGLIMHNSELLTTLINDILDLSALESGKYSMKLTLCLCNEMCQMALATVTHRKPEAVKLTFTSDVPDDFSFITDGQRTQQVLINFLTNAEKHTERGSILLHSSLTENPGYITFSVTDTGTGIPVDKMDSVFERFKKLDEFKQGTGLGLNICRIIAERLHGEVKVDKEYTGGARFLFILPLNQKQDLTSKER